MSTFEEYLQDRHAQYYDGTDDNMPDKFEAWVCELDARDMMNYAEQYGKFIKKETIKEVISKFDTIIDYVWIEKFNAWYSETLNYKKYE